MKTTELIKTHNIYVNKALGQNFLTDMYVLEKIIEAAGVCEDDTVLEIGAGLGTLTRPLADRARLVYAIEIDKNLCDILKTTFSSYKNINIINADILKTDVASFIKGRFKLVANLPYNIASAVIMEYISGGYDVDILTVMVQREVGERLRAAPGNKNYGALSVFASYYADVSLLANVPRNCFYPRPSVDSCVLRLKPKSAPLNADKEHMFKTIKAAFAQRRKTLVNCLFAAEHINLSKDELADIIKACGHSAAVRGEELGLYDFAALSDMILRKV